MTAAIVVFVYLAIVLYVGIFAFRPRTEGAEDFFVANRSLGTFVFLLSLFGSNMTSFAILGSSGLAFRSGIGVYGLMASISSIVIPLSIFVIGTRIWAIGKKFGHVTQVQIFRDRWEMGHIGTVIFALQAVMLVPYIIIGVMGGGETLAGVSGGAVPYWVGGGIVALVVMSYVFFGGMRGTAWVNTLQTIMFLVFGTIAFIVIARGVGGLRNTIDQMRTSPAPTAVSLPSAVTLPATSGALVAPPTSAPGGAAANRQGKAPPSDRTLLTRERLPSKGYYASYALIPLSSIMFPHIAIFCLTARRMSSFRKTVIFYPLCIMAIWLPAVYLGAIATNQPGVVASLAVQADGFKKLETEKPEQAELIKGLADGTVSPDDPRVKTVKGVMRPLAAPNADGVMLELLNEYAPAILAGILGAAIMACVMASDSQILALSTMWAEDVYAFYGGKRADGHGGGMAQVWTARVFVVILTVAAYLIALAVHQHANIFELAIQYAFSGYASMAPIMLACLFWRRSTKWGALSSTLWVAGLLIAMSVVQSQTKAPNPGQPAVPIWSVNGIPILMREVTTITFTQYRLLMVVPMFVGSALAMILFSLLTPRPSPQAIARYFPARPSAPAEIPRPAVA